MNEKSCYSSSGQQEEGKKKKKKKMIMMMMKKKKKKKKMMMMMMMMMRREVQSSVHDTLSSPVHVNALRTPTVKRRRSQHEQRHDLKKGGNR